MFLWHLILHLFLLDLLGSRVYAPIAYDCSDSRINITTVSLHSVGECNMHQDPIITQEVYGQLVQVSDERTIHMYTCKVKITRQIYYCGMHSHISAVLNGYASYIDQLGASKCKQLHETRTYTTPYGVTISGLRPNSSISSPISIGGTLDTWGSCKGGQYADPYGSWENVVVQGQIEVYLSDQSTTADMNKDIIFLPSGQRCVYSQMYCMDFERGETVWTRGEESLCGDTHHVLLYQGPMIKQYRRNASLDDKPTFSIDIDGRLVALRQTGSYTKCPWVMISTEHPKLVIHIPDSTSAISPFKKASPHDIDMMLYVNTKFVYLDRTIGKSVTELYHELDMRRCMSERKTLANFLSVATINPMEFAYLYTGQAGYTAAVMGEAVHIAQCLPVEVTLRKASRCYQEMPVTFKNESWFMAPRTRLLQKHATEVACDPMLSPMYHIQGTWYSLSPDLRIAKEPIVLAPYKGKEWRYTTPSNLVTAGLYTASDLEKMRMQLLHPSEKAAVENIIVQGSIGANIDLQKVDITNILTPKGLDTITESIAQKLWGWFSMIGRVSSGLVGIYVIWIGLKFLIDTLIHGKVLFDIFGKSVYLLGALWSSVTTYLITKNRPKTANVQHQDIEMSLHNECRNIHERPPEQLNHTDHGNNNDHTNIYPPLDREVPFS